MNINPAEGEGSKPIIKRKCCNQHHQHSSVRQQSRRSKRKGGVKAEIESNKIKKNLIGTGFFSSCSLLSSLPFSSNFFFSLSHTDGDTCFCHPEPPIAHALSVRPSPLSLQCCSTVSSTSITHSRNGKQKQIRASCIDIFKHKQ